MKPLADNGENIPKNQITVDISIGLSEKEATESANLFGENVITKGKRLSFIAQFIKNLGDPIIRILIGAMAINILFMFKDINLPETIGIGAAVFVAALVSTISEYGSEKAFDKLSEKTEKKTYQTLRNGKFISLSEHLLLCGDIIYLNAGEIIPADCIILKGDVTVNQAPLTGESHEVKKEPMKAVGKCVTLTDTLSFSVNDKDKLFKGCLCQSGECMAVVGRVGDNTFMGSVAFDLQKKSRPSPLKERLTALAKTVSYLGYIAAGLIMAAYLFNVFVIDSNFNSAHILLKLSDIKLVASSLLNAVTLGVSVIVVAVPEGLPMMITVVLSSNMKKMLKSGVLVRKPVGIETAGSMNILFTDKTGTLTTGNMKLSQIITRTKTFESARKLLKDRFLKDYIIPLSDGLLASGKKSATEHAVHNFFKNNVPDKRKFVLKEKVPFNSKNKYSACTYECFGAKRTYVLGAAEKLVENSLYYMDEDGRPKYMSEADKRYFLGVIREKANGCARVMALAEAKSDSLKESLSGSLPKELCTVFLLSVNDDLRPDIRRSVNAAKNAGVQVVMITGDNKDTAVAIAKQADIIDDDYNTILTGDEMAKLSDEALCAIIPKLAVVSRALPSDKLRLVELAGRLGLVSGMTGDGINDAPALKNADVGFAMGSGSDVAKEASDIILTNNSFHSITKAILYGRTVFESIRKFITFQLTMNLCAMGVSLICPFIGIERPVTVIQMLWVNIIMDTLGGLAFAGEIPLSKYMKRPPIKKAEKILTGKMAGQILFLGGFTLTLSLVFLKLPIIRYCLEDSSEIYFLTCFFALFIFSGIFNSFNARAPEDHLFSNLAGNKAFISIILFVCIGQIAIIYLGGSVFRTTPLKASDLAFCALLSLSVIPADMIRKGLTKFFSNKR